MKIWDEVSLRDFRFWSGGRDSARLFTEEELDKIETALEIENPDGMSDTQLNDIFWFEDEWLCGLIGVDYKNDYLKREARDD